MTALPAPLGQIATLQVPDFTPEHVVFIDFELFFSKDYQLKKLTTAAYVRDPRFEMLCVGVKIDGAAAVLMEHDEFKAWSSTWDWANTALGAHSPSLEPLVCAYHYGFVPGFYFDTIGMAHASGLEGNLEFLMDHFGVGQKGDELGNAKGKRRADFTDAEFAALGVYCIDDTEGCAAIFAKMTEAYPEPELWIIDTMVRMFSEPQLLLDEPMVREYMVEEKQRKADLLAQAGLDKKSVGSNEKLALAFRELGVDPPRKISPKTKKEVYAFAKNDVGMMALLEHEVDEVRWLAEARIAVKSTINESRGGRFLTLGKNGQPMSVQLNYYGAHTGRASGAGKCNFQNLERTNKKNPKKGRLKQSLLAPPGTKVVAVDSGAIEARGVAWLAEHKAMVAAFAQNRDLYSEFASTVYGRPIDRKARAEDEIPGFVGKTCLLGLGYGQGGLKLGENFLKGQSGPPVQYTMAEVETLKVDIDKFVQDERKFKAVENMLSRLDLEARVIHCAVADHLVKVYRKVNAPIPAIWKFMGDVIKAMDEGIEGYFGPNDCLQTVKNGILLPNGMMLRYPDLRQSKRGDHPLEDGEEDDDDKDSWRRKGYSYFDGQKRTRLYGGKLLENVCQALARIIVFEQMLHVRAVTGYRPVLSTHDEWAWLPPEADAPAFTRFAIETMKTTPTWARGWPLSAEGGFGPSYGTAK